MKPLYALSAASLMLASCAYPTSAVEQGGAVGRFRVSDAAVGTTILIDGRAAGQRSAAAEDLFPVSAGLHTVEERAGDRLILKKSYSVDIGATVEVRQTP